MILDLTLPNDSMLRMVLTGASAQGLESALCKIIGLTSVSIYDHHAKEVLGWKDGKQIQACLVLGRWKLYNIPDAK